MAEIRCPMCGKPNPDHLDVCQFCEARLKPLLASDSDSIFPDEAEDELPDWFDFDDGADDSAFADEAESEDWLTRLGGDPESPPEIEPSRAAARMDFDGDGVPDWLEDLEEDRTTPPLEATQPPSAEKAEVDELPDDEGGLPGWLSGMGAEEAPEQESVPAFTDEAEGLSDWLTEEEETPVSAQAISDEVVPAEEDELPAWLKDMAAEQAATEQDSAPALTEEIQDLPDWDEEDVVDSAQAVSAETQPVDEGELPAWLVGDEDETISVDAVPADEGELPAWLTDMEGVEEAPDQAAAEPESVPAFTEDIEDLPDLLTEEDDASVSAQTISDEAVPVDEEELPDWLQDMAAAEEGPAQMAEEQEAVPAFTEDVEDLPDWLDGEDDAAVSDEAVPADEEGLPAWLADMETAEEGPAQMVEEQEAVPAFTEDVEDLPDWLEGEDETDVSEQAVPADEEELPAWLADMETAEEAPAQMVEEQESVPAFTEDVEDLPDWLKSEDEIAVSDEAVPADEGELPVWLADMEAVDLTPPEEIPSTVLESDDLLGELADQDTTEERPPAEIGAQPTPTDDGESRAVPDWLRDMEGTSVADEDIVPEDIDAPFISDEEYDDDSLLDLDQLPDWISEEEMADVDGVGEAAPDDQDELSPAELPGWLAAMRPVDSGAADGQVDQPSGPAESSGPLAGLYSVLAAEPDIARIKAPPVYSSKLEVSQAQQGNAGLLSELLKIEGRAQALPLPPLISSRRLFRAILGLIIVVVAFLSVFMDRQVTALPALGDIPSGVIRTGESINALNAEDTVLIAFDYEPGFAGEMDATAAAVIDSMMLRNVKLAFVSTSPTGPLLAERFVRVVQQKHAYASGTQYINLGYLPGGVSGLFAFSQNPSWIAPNDLNGKPAWDTEPLKNIAEISDFALTVMIVDNPNTARAWIEQVQPQLRSTPLIAIVSAQVEPIVQPYYDAQPAQINGLVSGLMGGAAYEAISQGNLARDYWDTFNIMLVVTVGTILIGGVINIISDLLTQRKDSGGESA